MASVGFWSGPAVKVAERRSLRRADGKHMEAGITGVAVASQGVAIVLPSRTLRRACPTSSRAVS